MNGHARFTKPKTPHDVRGFITRCPEYHKCPICYGCRNFNPSVARCLECAEEKKKNVCDTAKHQADKIAKLLSFSSQALQ